jgi:predicted Zn-dependent protease
MRNSAITLLMLFALGSAAAAQQCSDGYSWNGNGCVANQNRGALQTVLNQMAPGCHGSIQAYITSSETGPVVHDRLGARVNAGDPLTSAAFVQATENVMRVFKTEFPGRETTIALAAANEINAWAITGQNGWVCVPTAMVSFMGNEDEIAFMVAHELGHTVDDECRARTQITRENQTVCEIRADEIGYRLLRTAGYSPYAAAGMFGKLEMYLGDTSTGINGFFRQLSIDHPITPKRIENMRRLLAAEAR